MNFREPRKDKVMNKATSIPPAPIESPQEEETSVELDSITLKRLLDEVRNEEAFQPSSYNRLHNRHNRTR
jgi:hypothetical protein